MKAVFTHPTFEHCIPQLGFRSPSQQLRAWAKMKGVKERSTDIINKLGKSSITATQAKRLDELGFTYSNLVELYAQSTDDSTFIQALRGKKVMSPVVPGKLAKILRSKLKPGGSNLQSIHGSRGSTTSTGSKHTSKASKVKAQGSKK